ncbi:hypothetical protein OY671_010661, partial [Metschnikowia pulcherrima]
MGWLEGAIAVIVPSLKHFAGSSPRSHERPYPEKAFESSDDLIGRTADWKPSIGRMIGFGASSRSGVR